jgi:hypothetical protein
MAKETGLGQTTLTLDDDAGSPQDIRNDVTNWDLSTPMNLQETTGVDKYAMERLGLLKDLTGNLNGVFNPATNRAHQVLSGNLRVARTLTHVISTASIASEVLISDYAVTRAAGGEFTYQSPYSLQNGAEPDWTVV